MAVLIEYLAELDDRRLCVGRGFPSLYEYCVNALKFSEGEAYRRIRAVRAVRKRPELLRLLEDGSLSLSAVVLLHPHLEQAHGDEALKRAIGLGTRRLEIMLAEYVTAPACRDSIRFIGMEAAVPVSEMPLSNEPAGQKAAESVIEGAPASAGPGPRVQPTRRKLVRFTFIADEDLFNLVRHAQALMRHKYPNGRLEGLFTDALQLLIEKKYLGLRAEAAAKRRTRRSGA